MIFWKRLSITKRLGKILHIQSHANKNFVLQLVNKLSTRISKKTRVLIGIPTILVTASILILCWIFLSEHTFFIVIVCLGILAIILQPLIKIYEERKKKNRLKEGFDSKKT